MALTSKAVPAIQDGPGLPNSEEDRRRTEEAQMIHDEQRRPRIRVPNPPPPNGASHRPRSVSALPGFTVTSAGRVEVDVSTLVQNEAVKRMAKLAGRIVKK